MDLDPDPFDPDLYPNTGTLYVRVEDRQLLRFEVNLGITLWNKENQDFVFTGTPLSEPKIVKLAEER